MIRLVKSSIASNLIFKKSIKIFNFVTFIFLSNCHLMVYFFDLQQKFNQEIGSLLTLSGIYNKIRTIKREEN